MTRELAAQLTRNELNKHGLKDWHVRLIADTHRGFLGMCSHKDKSIILNTHHIDIHPDRSVINTIKHEIAHALVGANNGHNEFWKAKAIEVGCENTAACSNLALDPIAIDAVRSGADLVVDFDEEVVTRTETIITPRYTVKKIEDLCEKCGAVAKEKSSYERRDDEGVLRRFIRLECEHTRVQILDSSKPYHLFISADADPKCKHTWNYTKCVKCPAKKLYSFQTEGARAMERANGRLGLFDEMGLGKTVQPFAYIHYNKVYPILFVVKAGIKVQFFNEISDWLGVDSQIIRKKNQKLFKGVKAYIVSYDLLRNIRPDKFNEVNIQLVISDECQQLKNPDSSRTQAFRSIVKNIFKDRTPKIIFTSGTPWKNRGSEFYTVLSMLDPKKFWSYQSFKNEWVDEFWDGNKLKEAGIRNPAKFKEYTKDIILRRERAEVMPELPGISRNSFVCEVDEKARQSYDAEVENLRKIYNDAVIGGEEDSGEVKKKMNDSIMVMRQIVGLAKVDATVDWVSEFLEDTDRKVVIFVHHILCGDLIHRKLTDYCIANKLPIPLRLNSELNAQERYDIQDKFNNTSTRVLVASTLASGEGLNLQSCSDCVMHERQWNPANEEQAEGRFIRIGQKANAVNATYMHGDDTVDQILHRLVEGKRGFFHAAMNKGAMPVWSETALTKEIVKELLKKPGKAA